MARNKLTSISYRAFFTDEKADILERAGCTLYPFTADPDAFTPDEKVRVVDYLKRGGVTEALSSSISPVKDIFTGEIIPGKWSQRADGHYTWSNSLYWYVEKYDLALPEDFKAQILFAIRE